MERTRRVLVAALAIAAVAAPVRAQDGIRPGVVRGAVPGYPVSY
ncbi:MAG TPA: hypothetical protein VF212_13890 [Longimicrobiales bacterium]